MYFLILTLNRIIELLLLNIPVSDKQFFILNYPTRQNTVSATFIKLHVCVFTSPLSTILTYIY